MTTILTFDTNCNNSNMTWTAYLFLIFLQIIEKVSNFLWPGHLIMSSVVRTQTNRTSFMYDPFPYLILQGQQKNAEWLYIIRKGCNKVNWYLLFRILSRGIKIAWFPKIGHFSQSGSKFCWRNCGKSRTKAPPIKYEQKRGTFGMQL